MGGLFYCDRRNRPLLKPVRVRKGSLSVATQKGKEAGIGDGVFGRPRGATGMGRGEVDSFVV